MIGLVVLNDFFIDKIEGLYELKILSPIYIEKANAKTALAFLLY